MEDLRLLRQLWKSIDPQAHIGNDTPETKQQKEIEDRLQRLKLAKEKAKMNRKVQQLRRTGRLSQLTRGERVFCRGQQIAFV